MLQEGTEQLSWRSNRPPKQRAFAHGEKGISQKPPLARRLAPSLGRVRVQVRYTGRQNRGAKGNPGLDAGKEKVHARVSEAYKELLHLRQRREGLTKKARDVSCIPGKE